MESNPQTAPVPNKWLWTSYIMSALPALLLLFSGVMKLVQPTGMEKAFGDLGWDMKFALGLGILELACTILYLIPRTAVLGAILLTAYMGGAIATHVRIGDLYVMQILLGVLVWGGLYLRDVRLRALIPLRS
jgi:uncharacterized membrane protein YphA (DoxX/SURF4 family)